jgi:hypothetical protein
MNPFRKLFSKKEHKREESADVQVVEDAPKGNLLKWKRKVANNLSVLQDRFKVFDPEKAFKQTFQRTIADIQEHGTGWRPFAFDSSSPRFMDAKGNKFTFDDAENPVSSTNAVKRFNPMQYHDVADIPEDVEAFYARGFINWQRCAVYLQHEMINRACAIPGEDALASGYDIQYVRDDDKDSDGDGEADDTVRTELDSMKKKSTMMGLEETARMLDYFKRGYGMSVAFPYFAIMDSDDDRDKAEIDAMYGLMEKPLNFETLKGRLSKWKFKGWSVVEPYWLTPQFDRMAASNPVSKRFFKPTWWMLPSGRKVHYTWTICAINSYVADILKPTYQYGGIPLPQMIYERVFAADKCANEAPLLALTKRLLVVDANIEQLIADPEHVQKLMDVITKARNNWGVVFKNPQSQIQQIDTSLQEVDALTMTQYQLVASIAQMPTTKLLMLTPTGFNSSGENEWKIYAQLLTAIQNNEYKPLFELHYKFLTMALFDEVRPVSVVFKDTDEPTEKERMEIEQMKASVASELMGAGIITPKEARVAVSSEEGSMFSDIPEDNDELEKRKAEETARLLEEMKNADK